MTRVKRGTISVKSRRNTLEMVKGYRFGRSKKERLAKEAIAHAGKHSFQHRRKKKGVMRKGWNITINTALRTDNKFPSYSKFIDKLKKANIEVDRKIMAQLAKEHTEAFAKLTEAVK